MRIDAAEFIPVRQQVVGCNSFRVGEKEAEQRTLAGIKENSRAFFRWEQKSATVLSRGHRPFIDFSAH